MRGTTCEALRARTHRPGVRDRAALERDAPIDHVNNATTALRTADAATPAATGRAPRPPTPGPCAHPARLASPPRAARTLPSVSEIATASNSAMPLSMESTPPPSPLPCSPYDCAQAHCTAAKPPPSSPFAQASSACVARLTAQHAAERCRRASRHRCNMQRVPMQHAPMQHLSTPDRFML
jgi:hypothetical protein